MRALGCIRPIWFQGGMVRAELHRWIGARPLLLGIGASAKLQLWGGELASGEGGGVGGE